MNTTWGAGSVPPPPVRLHRELAAGGGRERLGVKWEREVLVVPTMLLLTRGRRGEGRDRCEVPAKRAGLLRACPQRELTEREK